MEIVALIQEIAAFDGHLTRMIASLGGAAKGNSSAFEIGSAQAEKATLIRIRASFRRRFKEQLQKPF